MTIPDADLDQGMTDDSQQVFQMEVVQGRFPVGTPQTALRIRLELTVVTPSMNYAQTMAADMYHATIGVVEKYPDVTVVGETAAFIVPLTDEELVALQEAVNRNNA